MAKSAQAFRTIREVADWLDVAAHVLRFWESKFSQIKPVKRAGGRRYYRPADMELVGGIKVLLHDRGLTIRGVQKLIADEGLEAVTSLSPPIDELIQDAEMIELGVSDGSDAWDEDAAAEAAAAPPPQDAPPTPEEAAPEETVAEDAAPEEAVAEEAAPEAATPEDAAPVEDTPAPAPEPDSAPAPEPAPHHAPIPAPSPTAEGVFGQLNAIAQLPATQRAAIAPQIMALAHLRDRLRDRIPTPPDAG